jgi:hypothetical protein
MRYTRNKNGIPGKKRSKTIKKMNCSPAAKAKRAGPDTCYSKDVLFQIKKAYNDSHPSEKIKSNNPSVIWTELKDRMSNCPTEDCWLKEIQDPVLKKQIDKFTFAPDKPPDWKKDPNAWLSNYDIENVLKQYEITHKEFKLLGPSSIDYDTKLPEEGGKCVWEDLCKLSISDLKQKGKVKLGIVFNLDKHDEPGSHWVSMFVDINEAVIFYYDSALNDVPPEITRLKNEIIRQGKEIGIRFKYHQNKHEHQRTDTECGMYCLFFIITFLTSEIDHPIKSFRKIKHGGGYKINMKNKIDLFMDRFIDDKYVEKYRNILFN